MTSSVAVGRLREWIAAGAELARWRGTPRGLRMLLEAATGATGFTILEGVGSDGEPRPFHLRVIAPRSTEPDRALIARIIELEKPAYMTADPPEFADRS